MGLASTLSQAIDADLRRAESKRQFEKELEQRKAESEIRNRLSLSEYASNRRDYMNSLQQNASQIDASLIQFRSDQANAARQIALMREMGKKDDDPTLATLLQQSEQSRALYDLGMKRRMALENSLASSQEEMERVLKLAGNNATLQEAGNLKQTGDAFMAALAPQAIAKQSEQRQGSVSPMGMARIGLASKIGAQPEAGGKTAAAAPAATPTADEPDVSETATADQPDAANEQAPMAAPQNDPVQAQVAMLKQRAPGIFKIPGVRVEGATIIAPDASAKQVQAQVEDAFGGATSALTVQPQSAARESMKLAAESDVLPAAGGTFGRFGITVGQDNAGNVRFVRPPPVEMVVDEETGQKAQVSPDLARAVQYPQEFAQALGTVADQVSDNPVVAEAVTRDLSPVVSEYADTLVQAGALNLDVRNRRKVYTLNPMSPDSGKLLEFAQNAQKIRATLDPNMAEAFPDIRMPEAADALRMAKPALGSMIEEVGHKLSDVDKEQSAAFKRMVSYINGMADDNGKLDRAQSGQVATALSEVGEVNSLGKVEMPWAILDHNTDGALRKLVISKLHPDDAKRVLSAWAKSNVGGKYKKEMGDAWVPKNKGERGNGR